MSYLIMLINSFSDIIITLQIENTSLVQNECGFSEINSWSPEWALVLSFLSHIKE